MLKTSWVRQRCLRSLRRVGAGQLRYQTTVSAGDDIRISPALLSRARFLAEEHAALQEKLANGFENRSAKRLGEISAIATALKEWNKAQQSLAELNSLLKDPSTDEELRALAKDDLTATSERLDHATNTLATRLIPKHPFSHLPCLIEIRPGAGGSEAAIFAGEILRMYQSFCSQHGLPFKILKHEDVDATNASGVALQEAVLEVPTEGAYGIFRTEAGVHRVQRVPATETKGRTHTSAVGVLVLPKMDDGAGQEDVDDPSSDFYLDLNEVRVDTMRASGSGGQHVNTTSSAVRLTHIPTGITVHMQEERSQPRNKDRAFTVLRGRLAQSRRDAREEEQLRLRRSVVGAAKMGREYKIRTYNWSQARVTDHRSGITVHDLEGVMEGGEGFERVMESVKSWLVERDLEALVAEEEARESAA